MVVSHVVSNATVKALRDRTFYTGYSYDPTKQGGDSEEFISLVNNMGEIITPEEVSESTERKYEVRLKENNEGKLEVIGNPYLPPSAQKFHYYLFWANNGLRNEPLKQAG